METFGSKQGKNVVNERMTRKKNVIGLQDLRDARAGASEKNWKKKGVKWVGKAREGESFIRSRKTMRVVVNSGDPLPIP